jgi:hypothetical protein
MGLKTINESISQKPNSVLKVGFTNYSSDIIFKSFIFNLLVKGNGSPFKKNLMSPSVRSNLNLNND